MTWSSCTNMERLKSFKLIGLLASSKAAPCRLVRSQLNDVGQEPEKDKKGKTPDFKSGYPERRETFEFSLNVFTEFSEILYFKKIIRTCHLLCKRPRYQRTSKMQIAERIFKQSPVHVSVIYQMPWIHRISDPFRETPIVDTETVSHCLS